MKIVKFPDDYMRSDGKTGRYHYYAVFKNRKNQNVAIALTHISRPDKSREEKVKNGEIKNIRLKVINEFCDSGITNYIYSTSRGGRQIDLVNGEIVLDKVSSHSAKKIKKFAYSNPKYISYKK